MRFYFLALLLTLTFLSCSENNNPPKFAQNQDISKKNPVPTNDKFAHNPKQETILNESTKLTGISTSPNVLIKEGIIVITLKNGAFQNAVGTNLKIVINDQINGTLLFKDAVTMATVNGTTIVTNNKIEFSPETKLDPSNVYKLVFIESSGKEHSERIFISGFNACNSDYYFAQIPVQAKPSASNEIVNLVIKENIYNDPTFGQVAAVGWDHQSSKSFHFRINNRTPGAKYKIITALGSYNIPEHECELYYQRAINSPFPTWTDNNYGYKITKVTNEDTSIHNQKSKEYYIFTKTYVLLKVFNSSNVDITSTDQGILSLQQTDSLYGLPISFNSEEESSLLAYLNRGNNNSYSMVLGGLIVGIFGFFLSRRLMKRKEDN